MMTGKQHKKPIAISWDDSMGDGDIIVHSSFRKIDSTGQLDCLQDAIAELQGLYDIILTHVHQFGSFDEGQPYMKKFVCRTQVIRFE